MTDLDRVAFKRAIVLRLDGVAEEHRLGHQDAYANRYKMKSADDAPIELMFEKGAEQLANLWMLAEYVAPLLDRSIAFELSPKSRLYTVPAKNGGMQYGRHSALEDMMQLGRADLVRFDLASMAELDRILATLSQEKRKGGVR